MHDTRKTKTQLIAELKRLRERVSQLDTEATHDAQIEVALRRASERLQNLYAISLDNLMARSPEEIARTALRHLRHLIPCRHADITLIDHDTHEIVVLAVDADQPTLLTVGTRLPIDAPWITQLRQNIAIVIDDLSSSDAATSISQRLAAESVWACASVPLMVQSDLIGALNLGADQPDFFTAEYLLIAHEVADSIAVAIQTARLVRSMTDQREQLRALTARLSELQEAERQHLARELHDRVGQNLTALGINLNIVRSQLSPEAHGAAIARIDHSLQLVAETVERIRDVMAELRPPVLDDYGLLAALRWHGERFAHYAGLTVYVEGEECTPRLPLAVELALFRIVQEALTNIARHARAEQVTITLSTPDDRAQLTIADDGIGFDLLEQRRSTDRPKWGLMTMRERVEAVDGRLQIDSSPGHGTRILVTVRRAAHDLADS